MKWYAFRLKTTVEAEDIVASMLMDLGIEGVEIDNTVPLTAREQGLMFVDIMPEKKGEEGVSFLNFYLEDGIDTGTLLVDIRKGLDELADYVDIGDGLIEVSQTDDIDWLHNWKEHFHQFYIDDILITPSWEPVQATDRDKLIVQIDPGTAFGTGMHETTQLCIRQLRKYVKTDDDVLDVGIGSGILGMLALKFGATHVVGTDLDIQALAATHENMERNGLTQEQYQVHIGNLIDDDALKADVGAIKYDVVVANILADVLTELTPVINEFLKPGGVYICSGIIQAKEQVVVDAVLTAGLELLAVDYQGEWVAVTAKKVE